MGVTLGDRLIVPEDVVSRKLGEETVLLNLKTGVYFGLDPVGTRFLELLQDTGELSAVHGTMLQEYDVAPERLEADLLRLSEECLAKGLLVRG